MLSGHDLTRISLIGLRAPIAEADDVGFMKASSQPPSSPRSRFARTSVSAVPRLHILIGLDFRTGRVFARGLRMVLAGLRRQDVR